MRPAPARFLLAGVLFFSGIARADAPPAFTGQAAFFAAALSEFFSDSRSFVANAELRLPADKDSRPVTIPFGMAMLEGRLRCAFDFSPGKNNSPPEEFSDLVRQLNLDHLTVLIRPDTNLCVIVPNLRAYAETALPRIEAVQEKAQGKIGRLEKIPLGKESVEGHVCEKFRLVVRDDAGSGNAPKPEAILWQSPALHDLPVRLQVKFPGQAYDLRLRNIKLGKPDARHFVPPVDYARHSSVESLLQAAAVKSLTASGTDWKSLGAAGSSLKAFLGN